MLVTSRDPKRFRTVLLILYENILHSLFLSHRNLITSGADGNIFLYDFAPPEGIARPRSSKFVIGGPVSEGLNDSMLIIIITPSYYSYLRSLKILDR